MNPEALSLMRRMTKAQERIAGALEKLAGCVDDYESPTGKRIIELKISGEVDTYEQNR